jgi:hypothetical protein
MHPAAFGGPKRLFKYLDENKMAKIKASINNEVRANGI